MKLPAALLVSALALAAQDRPPRKATISGTVVNSVTGQPLTKVEVQAEIAGHENGLVAETATGGQGNFTLVDLEAGEYRLKGLRNGYLDTYYGARRAGTKGTTLTLEAGQEMTGLQLKLVPFGVIAGTVRDADGEPISGATVSILRRGYLNGRRTIDGVGGVATDDLGQYRVGDLPPGQYYVMAGPNDALDFTISSRVDHSPKSAEPPLVLIPTVFPGGGDFRNARAVAVTAGARITGTDIQMQRSRVFQVTVHVSAPAGLDLAWPELGPPAGQEGPFVRLISRPRNTKGDFQFRDVPPGAYTLTATAQPPEPRKSGAGVSDSAQRRYRASVPLIVSNADAEVRVAISSGTGVTGRIRVEGGSASKLAGDEIDFDGPDDTVLTRILEDSTFSTGLYGGRYRVSVKTSEPNLIVKSVRADGADATGGLTVPESGKIELEIVLAPEGGQVDGVTLDPDDKPVGGATVVLVPEDSLRSHYRAFSATTTDQLGRYHFVNVPPGEYKVFAWDDVEEGAWFDAEFLKDFESRGTPVTLAASGHGTAQVRVIAAAGN